MLPQILDDCMQRVIEILVITTAKTVARHNDVAAKGFFGRIQRHQVCTFGRGEQRAESERSPVGIAILEGQPNSSGRAFLKWVYPLILRSDGFHHPRSIGS